MHFLAKKILLGDTSQWFHELGHMMIDKDDDDQDQGRDPMSVQPPFFLLLATAGLVIGSLIYRGDVTKKPYPTNKLFFCFSVASLIMNFYLFVNPFMMAQSKNRVLKVVTYFASDGENAQTAMTICWIFCWFRVAQFFAEAFRIFALESDTMRTMQILYHMHNSLIKPWIASAFPEPAGVFAFVTGLHSIFDTVVSSYFAIEPILCEHFAKNQPDIEFYVVLLQIWQHVFTAYQILPLTSMTNYTYDFKAWTFMYIYFAAMILGYILYTGVDRDKAIDPTLPSPKIAGVRLSPYKKDRA